MSRYLDQTACGRNASLVIAVLLSLSLSTQSLSAREPDAPTTAIYSVALVDVSPDRTELGASVLRREAQSLRAAAGCLRVQLMRQRPPSANHFALLTAWRDTASRDLYLASAASRAFRAQLQPFAASPVDDRLYVDAAP